MKNRLFRPIICRSVWLLCMPLSCALADENVCLVADESGAALLTFAGSVTVGDEYVSADNTLYRISSVQGAQAVARKIGTEPMPDVSWLDTGAALPVFMALPAAASNQSPDANKLIAMYVTHSDESYIPGHIGLCILYRAFKVARDDPDAVLSAESYDVSSAHSFKNINSEQ